MRRVVYLLSDSTGETVSRLGAAALSLFDVKPELRLRIFLRTPDDIDSVVREIRAEPGPVIVTMVDEALRARLLDEARSIAVPVTPVLQPVIAMFETVFGKAARPRMGGQHVVDEGYYRRVDAIEYAIGSDDGALTMRLGRADVILSGVSRTSKTPTCIYLAVRGVKAANVPLVPGLEPPRALFEAVEQGVPLIGLTASPARLVQIRSHRLDMIGADRNADYAALETVRRELAEARLLFDRLGATVIDVTRRSIEETAAEIMALLRLMGRVRP